MTSPTSGADRPPRVLIADDTPPAVELLEEFLDGAGYELRAAYDGEETLRMVTEWQPDLILLDIMMPRISGFEVCKQVRSNHATQDIAILMVTALDQPSDIDRAVEAGTDDFLRKPINKAELLLRVRSLLRIRNTKQELERALDYIQILEQGGAQRGAYGGTS